jgi:hypothetical protein
MHEDPREHTGHRIRAKRWGLALLWAAGTLVLALATAVIFVAVYWIEGV